MPDQDASTANTNPGRSVDGQGASEAVLVHVLFIDVVGSSKFTTDTQRRTVCRLQEIVRDTPEFQPTQDCDELIRLPTGDGMALVFLQKLDTPILCAVEISRALKISSLCKVRMGIHSGPVFIIEDINGNRNASGDGRVDSVMPFAASYRTATVREPVRESEPKKKSNPQERQIRMNKLWIPLFIATIGCLATAQRANAEAFKSNAECIPGKR